MISRTFLFDPVKDHLPARFGALTKKKIPNGPLPGRNLGKTSMKRGSVLQFHKR